MFRVEELKDKTEWEDFLLDSPDGTFYHSLKWKEAIEKSFGHKPMYLTIRDASDRILGIFPSFLVKLVHSTMCYSTPYSDYAGPILSASLGSKGCSTLLDFLINIADDRHISYAKVMTTSNYFARVFHSSRGAVDRGVGVMEISLLDKSSDLIWRTLSTNIRRSIKRIERSGFQANEARTRSDLRQFYDLYSSNMKYIGGSPFPYEFIENMWNILYPQHLRIWILEKNGGVAGELFLKDSKSSYAYLTGLDRKQNTHEAISYMRWKEIRRAEEEGLAAVSFGLTPSDPMHRYHLQKSRLGCRFHEQKTIWHPLSSTGAFLIQARLNIVPMWKTVRTVLPRSLVAFVESHGNMA